MAAESAQLTKAFDGYAGLTLIIIAEEILFVFCFEVWLGAWTLALRLISLLDHGDFSQNTLLYLTKLTFQINNNMLLKK